MTITTRLYTAFCGKLIGSDVFGNKYYVEKRPVKGRTQKRWVMYNGAPEPSKVPAEWHGWLHYTNDTPPSKRPVTHHSWEKPYLPNLTGTVNAHLPAGHERKGGKRAPAASDYEAWEP